MRTVLPLFSIVSCLILFSGCSSTSVSGLAPAEGKVLLDGNPLGEVNIVFMPVAGSSSDRYATTVSKSDGTFRMNTSNSPGVLPGKYSITFSKKILTPKVSLEEELILTEEGKPIPDPDVEYIVPAKYEKAETSGFTIEIDASGKKDILFELTK